MKKIDIEEMKKHEWTISWSGGKDSTATVILCHEYGIPIKEIIYVRMMYDNELPATLPVMTEFVDRTIGKFESWGYSVRMVKSIKSAKDLMNAKYIKSKRQDKNGKVYGITAFARGWCNFTTVKRNTIKQLFTDNEYEMVGYAIDEVDRIHRLTDKKQSIMVTLGIEENQTFDICRKYNMLSPLYNLGFYRDGCWFCPNAGKYQRQYLRDNHRELVEEINKSIEMCDYDLSSIYKRNKWVEDYFKAKEKGQCNEIYQQISLFEC